MKNLLFILALLAVTVIACSKPDPCPVSIVELYNSDQEIKVVSDINTTIISLSNRSVTFNSCEVNSITATNLGTNEGIIRVNGGIHYLKPGETQFISILR